MRHQNFDRWYILSAKHGLVKPDDVLEPYDLTLNTMTVKERRAWAEVVLADLMKAVPKSTSITFLAGKSYRAFLVEPLRTKGYAIHIPMEGLGIGKQLQWLSANSQGDFMTRQAHLEEFYRLLNELSNKVGGTRRLAECRGKMNWPSRGSYFFFEAGEYRSDGETMRVVRVGTHAVSSGSKTTLWNRLYSHRGMASGGGNHRGSIFRLHVGRAMINRDGDERFPHWGKGANAKKPIKQAEDIHERRVSEHIGNMPFLWLKVDDEPSKASDRAFIERNAIILLAGADGQSPLDIPSPGWLGRHSDREKIQQSGLWNLAYIGSSDKLLTYDPAFLRVFRQHLDEM